MQTELVGNALCLDFANTVNQRVDPGHDQLTEPDGLRDWAVLAGLPRPSRRPSAADLDEAVVVRDAVYRVFSAVADERRPASRELARLAAIAAEGLAAAVLTGHTASSAGSETSYGLRWRTGHARRVLWAVADSAVELLRHGPLDRVGECPSCGWVFLDTSRNGRRRWCSMAMCGGAEKSARHYERTRGS